MAALISALVLLLASAIVGAAALRACGKPVRAGYGPAVGLSLLIVVASVTIRLPGDVLTAVLACAVLLAGCAAWAGRGLVGPVERSTAVGLAAVAALLAVPYLIAGEVGILGVGINFDMSVHVAWAETLRADGIGEPLGLPGSGYPLGPHGLVATLGSALGVTTDDAFGGFALAVAPIAFLAALALLDWLPPPRRALAAVLTALPYLMAAYHGQGAFKETTAAALLIAFLAILRGIASERRITWGDAALMAAIGAGAFYNYSYLGLSWFAGALGIWLVLELAFGGGWVRPSHALDAVRGVRHLPRRSALVGLGVVVVVGAALAPEISRALTFFDSISFSPDSAGGIKAANTGNLTQPLSPYEALGVWPKDDFRDYFSSGQRGFEALASGGIGALAALFGGAWWLRRRDFVVPAAVIGAVVIYVYLRAGGESFYVQAKALAVLAPLAMALSAGGLLSWRPQGSAAARAVAVLTVVFVIGAGVSTFAALRGAWVEPGGNVSQLDSLRPVVAGSSVLVIPTDYFANYRLRGAHVSGDVITQPVKVDPRPQKPVDPTRQVDFDWVTPATLDRFDYVLTNRSSYGSEPPANFRRVRQTASYALYKRQGQTPRRRLLSGEGLEPGAVMDCSTGEGALLRRRTGWARVRSEPVVAIGPPGRRLPRGIRQSLEPGQTSRRRLVLSPGRWELSMIYNGVRRPELEGPAGLRFPADQTDPASTYWRLGEIRWNGGPLDLTATAAALPLGAMNQRADVGELAAVRVDQPAELLPLARACGHYVDWYTLGAERPPVPRG